MSLTSYIGINVELPVNADGDVRENILYIGSFADEDMIEEVGKKLDKGTLKVASLTDGSYKKPIDNQGNIFARYGQYQRIHQSLQTAE